MFTGKLFVALGAVLVLSACDVPQSAQVSSLSTQPTSSLCARHMAASGIDLLAIEAELGARGTLQCATAYGGKSYIGAKTEATVGRSLYARSSVETASRDDKNCSDFASAGEAQRFFIASGGPHRDPHGLDGDGDGNACDWGKTLKSSTRKYKPAPVKAVTPRRSSSRTCYTGPRGGRYYYSASGNKVYGC